MGRIKEERRRRRKKRIINRIVIGASVVVFVAALMVLIPAMRTSVPTDNDIVKQPTQESTKETQSIDLQGGEIENTDALSSESESSEPESLMPEEPDQIQLVMVGDMLMHTRIIESGKKEDGTYNFDHLFTHVKDYIQSADLAIVNQETILGGPDFKYSGYPSFNSPFEVGDALVNAGFDVILHATNHTLDKGKKAVLNCMDFWETNYPEIGYVGINRTQEDRDNVFIYEKNGIKVAILNYTYSTNGKDLPSDMPFIVNLFKESEIVEDIKKAEELADFTIVCPHWGQEYSLGTNSFQKKWTKVFLENGVDLVLGAHPHVIEPIEWVKDDDGHQMLVYYSLGNYVNGTSSTKGNLAHRMVGGIADVTLERNEEGKVVIAEHDVEPIVCHIDKGEAYTVYYLKDYTKEMALENQIILQDSKFCKEACDEVVNQVWGEQ